MPFIEKSTYRATGIFKNGHLNTMHAGLIRRVDAIPYIRERINTADGDFLDIDWIQNGHRKLVILLHGLEGNSQRPYVTGMAKYFYDRGFDALAMNFRGCGGEPNALPRSYHIGETGDLHTVIQHAREFKLYDQIVLIGFSMGGNMVLKYLGEQSSQLYKEIKCSATFSVPCHVTSANLEIDKWYNWHYRKNLVGALNETYKDKMKRFPEQFEKPARGFARNFREFDEHYTAPVHGFSSADEYWDVSSCIHFISDIQVPSLLVNSLDDSFLSNQCYPKDLAKNHPYFHLEIPEHGGHLGFVSSGENGDYWTERRAFEFVSKWID